MQRQRTAVMFGTGTGDGENLGHAHGAQFARQLRLRLDQNAGPARLFEVPGLRTHTRLIGADLDEVTFRVAEKRGDHLHLGIEGRHGNVFHLFLRAALR